MLPAASQPPLLSAMVRALHEAAPDEGRLRRALPLLVAEHAYWTRPPKQVTVLAGGNGAAATTHALSRCARCGCDAHAARGLAHPYAVAVLLPHNTCCMRRAITASCTAPMHALPQVLGRLGGAAPRVGARGR